MAEKKEVGILKTIFGGDGTDGVKMSVYHLYRSFLLDYINRGVSTKGPSKAGPDADLYASANALYSQKHLITVMYTIDAFPDRVPVSFRTLFREAARGSVRVSFMTRMEAHRIDWNSPRVQSRLKTWENMDNQMGEVDAYSFRENAKQIANNEWRQKSLFYLNDAELRRGRKLYKTRQMMLIQGVRGQDMDRSMQDIERLAKNHNFQMNRVSQNIDRLTRMFSPFSLQMKGDIQKTVGSSVATDEIFSRHFGYDQGRVGEEGLYWGTDIYSNSPVYKLAKRKEFDAENWLIVAETGGGKSFYVKVLLLQMLAEERFMGTIMDIEGFEYIPIAHYLANKSTVKILNMAEGQGSYFDPVEVFRTFDPELDKEMYSLSRSFTISLFKTIVSLPGNDWADILVDSAVSRTYADAGVSDDPESWANSKELTLFSVYESLKLIATEKRGIARDLDGNEDYMKAVDLVLEKTSRYFEPLERGGSRSDVFQHRVTLEEVRDAKLVVCSFGMAGKSADTIDEVQMSLTQLYAAHISHLRSLFAKTKGKFNFKIWEEFQRWGSFPDSEKTITTALTGGRKMGDINIILSNKPSELVDQGKFGIFENTTSFAIGAIPDAKIRRDLCDRLSIPHMLPELDKLVSESVSKQTDGGKAMDSPYKNAFLAQFDKASPTIARMSIPKDLAESDLLQTGVNLAGDLEGEVTDAAYLEEEGDSSYEFSEGSY